jgi:hypothetical protein
VREDLVVLGKAPRLHLAEDPTTIHADLEGSPISLDEGHLRSEPFLQLRRQTGGMGIVVSNHAVLDADLLRHVELPSPSCYTG